jgi:cardiolipin synthase (CMP-forming)
MKQNLLFVTISFITFIIITILDELYRAMKEEFKWTLPNILSVYRLCISPIILAMIILHYQLFFTVLLIISMITDILDGYIARHYNLQTAIGAKLDSYADAATILLAIYGMFRFEYAEITPYILPFLILIVFYISVYIFSFLKFKKFSSLHLYSSKITGYAQGIFFFILFCFKPYSWAFWAMFAISVLSYSEELLVIFLLKQARTNAKGLFWVLKKT